MKKEIKFILSIGVALAIGAWVIYTVASSETKYQTALANLSSYNTDKFMHRKMDGTASRVHSKQECKEVFARPQSDGFSIIAQMDTRCENRFVCPGIYDLDGVMLCYWYATSSLISRN